MQNVALEMLAAKRDESTANKISLIKALIVFKLLILMVIE